MGCCVSKIERQEMVSRCKARKRYMKQLVEARAFLSSSHSFYLRSLRSTGSALLQFSTAESSLLLNNHHHNHHLSPPTPPPPPSMSPSTDTWTTTTTTTNATPLPPPPPPPPVSGSSWDFWDPFAPPSAQPPEVEEDEWEEEEAAPPSTTSTTTPTTNTTAVRTAANVAAPPSVVSGFSKESEMAVVVSNSRQGKELVEIIKELDEYFLRAADAGAFASGVLELHSSSNLSSHFNHHHHHHLPPSGKVFTNTNSSSVSWSPMSWRTTSGKFGFRKIIGEDQMVVGIRRMDNNGTGHSSTIERLYAWEKKLFLEVKNAEKLKIEHEKRVEQLRRLEVKRADYFKTEKTKKQVEKLESQIEVASQAIQSTSNEIIKLRETELYPQLLHIVKGFMCMWRSMYECHQVQMHIVDQLKFLNAIPSTEPTSEIHRQSTLQLEVELQQWHQSFCNFVKAQRDYIRSLTGWLRLSLFQFNNNPLMRSIQDSTIYSLCEQWQLEIDNVPDKVASEGIKSLWTVIHAIVVQQAEELKQKKRSEVANKQLEKRAVELRSLEVKYGPYSMPDMSKGRDPVGEKRAKVEMLKAKAEDEKAKHEKGVSVTRAMTLNNMQMGLPHVFQAMTGFSSVCKQAFEKVYNEAKNMDQELDVKRLMMT